MLGLMDGADIRDTDAGSHGILRNLTLLPNKQARKQRLQLSNVSDLVWGY